MRIKTATGKSFHVRWCAVGSIDGALRFCITGVTGDRIPELLRIFTDATETATLTRINDDRDGPADTYEGFTVFKGADVAADGSVTVALAWR